MAASSARPPRPPIGLPSSVSAARVVFSLIVSASTVAPSSPTRLCARLRASSATPGSSSAFPIAAAPTHPHPFQPRSSDRSPPPTTASSSFPCSATSSDRSAAGQSTAADRIAVASAAAPRPRIWFQRRSSAVRLGGCWSTGSPAATSAAATAAAPESEIWLSAKQSVCSPAQLPLPAAFTNCLTALSPS